MHTIPSVVEAEVVHATGGRLPYTVTRNAHVELVVFPQPSVAVQLTVTGVVVPTWNQSAYRSHTRVTPPQLSLAVIPKLTHTQVPGGRHVRMRMCPGQRIVGGRMSWTYVIR